MKELQWLLENGWWVREYTYHADYGVPVFNLYFDDALEQLGQWLKESGYV